MSIKKYEVLLQTADLGSFTKASEVLGYTQSAISHIITGLEDELGLKLLSRDRFGVRLTAEGEALLPAIRTVCQENQEVLRQAARFHGLEVGRVRIGTFLSVSVHLLPHLLQTFSQRHPDITFELLQGSYEDIERWLSEGRIDLGFLRLPANSHFEATLLLEERILAIFPPEQAPESPRVTVEQLKQAPYILRLDSLDSDTREFFRKTQRTPPDHLFRQGRLRRHGHGGAGLGHQHPAGTAAEKRPLSPGSPGAGSPRHPADRGGLQERPRPLPRRPAVSPAREAERRGGGRRLNFLDTGF